MSRPRIFWSASTSGTSLTSLLGAASSRRGLTGSKEHLDMPAQMIQAIGCHGRPLFCLREDERSLHYRLGVKRQALCAKWAIHAVQTHCCIDIRFEGCSMAADRLFTGIP